MTHIFSSLIKYPAYNTVDTMTIIIVACISTVFPIFSNIVTMRRVLGKYIRESIDMLHNTMTEVEVSISRLNSVGVSL